MSGLPLRENKWVEAVSILRPILTSGKYQLTGHGSSEDLSAYNKLRQNPMAPEYLHTWQVKEGRSRAIFSFPSKAKSWGNVQTTVAFNAYQPSKLLQSIYSEEDIRAKDRQYSASSSRSKKVIRLSLRSSILLPIFDSPERENTSQHQR